MDSLGLTLAHIGYRKKRKKNNEEAIKKIKVEIF